MRSSQAEKMAIIHLVEESELSVRQTLAELNAYLAAVFTAGIVDTLRTGMRGCGIGLQPQTGSGTKYPRKKKQDVDDFSVTYSRVLFYYVYTQYRLLCLHADFRKTEPETVL
jgi:hypothetical protein